MTGHCHKSTSVDCPFRRELLLIKPALGGSSESHQSRSTAVSGLEVEPGSQKPEASGSRQTMTKRVINSDHI